MSAPRYIVLYFVAHALFFGIVLRFERFVPHTVVLTVASVAMSIVEWHTSRTILLFARGTCFQVVRVTIYLVAGTGIIRSPVYLIVMGTLWFATSLLVLRRSRQPGGGAGLWGSVYALSSL